MGYDRERLRELTFLMYRMELKVVEEVSNPLFQLNLFLMYRMELKGLKRGSGGVLN